MFCGGGGVIAALILGEHSSVMAWNGCNSPMSVSQVQTEVLQKRQREKAHMMHAIKKYQKGRYISVLKIQGAGSLLIPSPTALEP